MIGENSCVSDSGISTLTLRFLHLAVILPVALGHYKVNQCFTHTHTHKTYFQASVHVNYVETGM